MKRRNSPRTPRPRPLSHDRTKILAWAEIKRRVDLVVKDEEKVFAIDLGPGDVHIYVDRDHLGYVVIGDDPELQELEAVCVKVRSRRDQLVSKAEEAGE